MAYASYSSLLKAAHVHGSIAAAAAALEADERESSVEAVRAQMHETLTVMREAIRLGATGEVRSKTGLTGGDAAKLLNAAGSEAGSRPIGGLFAQVIGASVATAEVNAAMGRIVAAPTAGASGIVPAMVVTLGEAYSLSDDEMVDGLMVAAAIGGIFAASATLSGAVGGCQAETGTGAAMAAAAATVMLGGTSEQAGEAAALAMQGLLGLVCDPVAGLVEVPCVMRNATGAAVALAGAEMALAGIRFPIPLDEVVSAAARIGAAIPLSLRETAKGGLAITPTGLEVAARLESRP